MDPAENKELKAELTAYKGYLEEDGIPNMVADALRSVITCGQKYLRLNSVQPGAASGSSIVGTDILERKAVRIEKRLTEAYEQARAFHILYTNLFDEQEQKKDMLANMNISDVLGHRRENRALEAIARKVSKAQDDLKAARKELYDMREDQRAVGNELRDLAARQADLAARQADLAARQAAAVDAARSSFEKAKAEYREATMASAAMPARQGNIFEPMVLNWADTGISSHKPTTARFDYMFVYDPTIVPAVHDFQEKCKSCQAVAGFVAPPTSALRGTGEERFTQHIIAELGPRLEAILEGALGMQRTRFRQLGRNWGVDIELAAYMPHAINPVVAMPVEVKRNFGGKLAHLPAIDSDTARQNFRLNAECLSQMCGSVGGRNQLHVWYALTQTTCYVEKALFSSNRGVVIARDGVILIVRTNRNIAHVSGVIPYEGANPHPAAAIAFWIGEVLDNPCRTLELGRPVNCGSMRNPGSRRANTPSVSGLSADSHHMTTRNRGKNVKNIESPPTQGSMPAQEYGTGSKKDNPKARGVAVKRYYSSTTAIASASTLDDPDSDPLTGEVNIKETLTFERHSRCGYIYRAQLKNGQRVIIKAAPADNIEILDELRMEVRAYHRLRDLQGTIVPRVFSYGYATIDGHRFGILVIEFIGNDKIMSALDMDQRMELKNLTDAERTACLNALGAIHKRGVIHGDIRGANLLFRSHGLGNNLEPVFIDFGFAQLAGNATKLSNAKTEDYFRLLDTFKGINQYA